MPITIIKRNVTGKFTRVPNSLLNRNDLSWEAKGLLIYLISKPPKWEGRKADIKAHSPNISDYAFKKIIGELIATGFLKIKRKRSVKPNRICGSYYELGVIPEIEDVVEDNLNDTL